MSIFEDLGPSQDPQAPACDPSTDDLMVVTEGRALAIVPAPADPEVDLDAIAQRIKGRDCDLAAHSRHAAIETGRDLIKAKAGLKHGKFEAWCRENFNYSKSKAEKLIRVAKMLGPTFKSVGLSDLPALELLIELSAPCTREDIRGTFVVRIIAGENGEIELRAALKENKDERKRAKLQR